jgi:hypothetical protein
MEIQIKSEISITNKILNKIRNEARVEKGSKTKNNEREVNIINYL